MWVEKVGVHDERNSDRADLNYPVWDGDNMIGYTCAQVTLSIFLIVIICEQGARCNNDS